MVNLHMSEKNFSDHSRAKTMDIVIPAYNACKFISASIRSTLSQKLQAGWYQNIIIVDDGSSDEKVLHLQALFKDQVNIIVHPQNRGRSASRNTGWRAGSGTYVIFLDADCEWLSTESLAAHLQMLESGSDVSTGAIVSRDKSFWGKYQNMLQSSREKHFSSGNLAAFTSANFAIKRSVLEASGGFDEGYRHYGFEDRDFLLRLVSLGTRISFCAKAAIIHNPDSSLGEICRKMMESGQHSSARFQSVHPEYYSRSAYGKLDCRRHGIPLTALAMFFEPWIPGLASLGDKIINLSGVPFHMKKACVKMVSGLAYMTGTYRGIRKSSL